jgi:CheY-like chemotaxis protein
MDINWEGKRVVIAEDERVNYLFLKAALKRTNITILWAQNGQEAVDFVMNEGPVDVVLMDLKMPVMNGLEATQHIKKLYPSLPIIAQTAYTQSEFLEAVKQAGCDALLSKPIQTDTLINTIKNHLC